MPAQTVSAFEERLRAIRWGFQGLGAICCMLFTVQGIVIFINYSSADFWEACHWLSEGSLCVVIGVAGCFFEARSCYNWVPANFLQNAKYRIGLGCIYLWMGCYSVGGRIAEAGNVWSAVGQITGVVAWIVGVANFILSVFSERSEEPAARKANTSSGSAASPSTTAAGSGGAAGGTPASKQMWATGPGAGAGESPSTNPWDSGGGTKPAGEPIGASQPKASEAPAAAPPGGWNTFGGKPFGSS